MGMGARFGEQRRSHRVHIVIAVLLRYQRGDQTLQEDTTTTLVNSAGGLLLTSMALLQGQTISIVNKKTNEEIACKVAFTGVGEGNRLQVGFEFLEPAPKFWRISFPPDDWDASERKRPGEAQRAALKSLPTVPSIARK
jgi:hypothetical protein